ncbi:hypothetical protein MMC07_000734 [Pseudocyphellaria aurata]|nr:hypothetical protein [Pseudocyphellaria aurata]
MARVQVSLKSEQGLRADLSHANSQVDDGRVYILGIGNIGKLFAHSLAKKRLPPSMTLLTKATHTTAAISTIKHRLNEQSTILFTQNGMGLLQEVSEQLFPDTKSRPSYVASLVSHGLSSVSAFSSVHAGIGAAIIGFLSCGEPHDAKTDGSGLPPSSEPSRYLIQQILDTPSLAGKEVSSDEIIKAQMEKLIMNAMINPLTVIFDRRNGELFGHSKIQSLMQLLLGEASLVPRALPELQDYAGLASRFSPDRLERVVMNIAEINANNRSSMLQDVQAGKQTEIDYINGYIVKRGEQLGIGCVHNRTLVNMVIENRVINESQIEEFFPPGHGSH